VMTAVEYLIDVSDARNFFIALAELEHARRRNGAIERRVFRDLAS
jgi:hypothetical protein